MTARPSANRVALLPTTKIGRWAGWLLGSSLLLLAAFLTALHTEAFGKGFAAETAGRYALAAAFAASVLGLLITAGWAWLKHRDRSVVVAGAAILGVLLAALVVLGSLPA